MADIGRDKFLIDRNDFTPVNAIVAITPSDTVDLQYNGTATPARALIFTGAGNVVITCADGNDITLPITSAWFGVQYIRAKRIKATGTTAAGIFACY